MKTSVNTASFTAAKKNRVPLAELASRDAGQVADKALDRVLRSPDGHRPSAVSTFSSAL
ncbi:hypothetical protein N4G70_30400 [Streptomyces sp. ASQP_92]|uniref:hypothetical protein n=1 Tax=unclassified Streptomyces TaxID=2593676 RepID=UPI0021BF2472|nr:hypothetical protein [Streptomyces sp. ASQP_92]MCT9093144.1 hypothetical protein [Streptomyces sp. ASQP_92]